MGYFIQWFRLTLVRLCQQRWLLAGLALLCFLLPLAGGRTAGDLLSQGVDFNGVTLAVTAPEGDNVPQLLEQFIGDMEDIAQYCKIAAMDQEEAMSALERGEVTAVLVLPPDFIHGVMWGDNPDLRLVVSGDRPLESLLLLWVGQSACDILSAFQSGVYAVLELYEQAPPPGLTRDQVVFDINLRYIALAMDRNSLFQTQTVSATQALPIPLHYALSLTAYFSLAAAPLFVPIYSGDWLCVQRRLRSAGRGVWAGYFSGVAAGVPALLLLSLPTLLLEGEGSPLAAAGSCLIMALFCSVFCSLCCLVSENAASCGVIAFTVAVLSLALAGGIVPPVLLPASVRRLSWLSPVTWLRQLAAGPMGYPVDWSSWVCLGLSAAGMAALALALYRRRVDRQEVAL
ncbi:ABC transporter permease [Flintibacter muris]|uniref:ABC transporter permease n=1 Tax=Flintibacter muris TaxID=2941327 RepID=UPI0020424785|nr:ABC transporter permease [Flintibacter muris]